MRANTPSNPMGLSKGLPLPKFQIGQVVKFNFKHPSDKKYYLKKYVRHLLRIKGKIFRSLVRGGYSEKGKLPTKIKDGIREYIRVILNAEYFTVVGIKPNSSYNIDCTMFNECYIGGVSGASSPLSYDYQLMVKYTNDEGNKIALITGCTLVGESSLELVL
jgi:hypothetical protein